ncbi:hypothetical protein BCR35DRAFT_308189 [Leucosporidium creatinivorum]|uniref:Actin-domain-containing protein n=1 Tax=Leucosporidium creatinivorum TaxID=106004 RepID=A0A1Y2EC93_9BASI|nr:hypothetical protein BCR35DRAFT_308189 [Leucosporidium creatinivorum]
MVVRDELLVILDLNAGVIRGGVGVHDLIRAPQIEVSTSCGRRPSTAPYKIDDYVVGHLWTAAHNAGEQLEVVETMSVGRTGLEVKDWVGLEAIMRYVFHVGLPLPRPPLAHPCLLSLPPHLPPVLVDQFHALLFERLLVPQLLVATRPFFAAAAAGVLSAVILDIGNRNEGSEISVVHENQVVEGATMRLPLDEGVLDDWTALKLLEEDPDLPRKISPEQELGPGQLAGALRSVVASLKAGDVIGFASPAFAATKEEAAAEDGELDIAKALVEGKVKDIVSKKKGKKGADGEDEGDFVEVPHPLNTAAEALRIGPARHRYLEPLFLPHLLAGLAPSASPAAALLGLGEYEGREVLHAGVQEMIGTVVEQVDDLEERRAVWEAVVIMSAGKVANNKALGPTLIPLLKPFTIDPESGSESQPKTLRYARTPEYFSEYKERGGELGCFLGGCIMAKLLIGDLQSRLFMSKVDYTSFGPSFYRLLDKYS